MWEFLAHKSAMEDAWEPSIERSLPHLNSDFVSLIKYNHTDLQSRDEKSLRDMELTLRGSDVILIERPAILEIPGLPGRGRPKNRATVASNDFFIRKGRGPSSSFS